MKEDYRWLLKKAEELVQESRLEFDDGSVRRIHYIPVGYGRLMYLRDFEYMVEGCPTVIGVEEIKKGYLYFLEKQRPDGAIPMAITEDNVPIYSTRGMNIDAWDLDSAPFLVKLIYEYYNLSKDISLFRETKEGIMKAMDSIPLNPKSGLPWIDPVKYHVGYGFTDTILKTGDDFFCSLLYYEALNKLSELCGKVEDSNTKHHLIQKSKKVKVNLQEFWEPQDSLFLAASIDCKQPDIWGSAYAVYLGVTSPEQTKAISKFMVANYSKIVKRGQVRHLIEGTYWEKFFPEFCKSLEFVGPGKFQNGAYWGVPAGWVSYALRKTNPSIGDKILLEMVQDYKSNGVYECINDRYARIKNYVASAALPAKEIRRIVEEQ